MSDPVDYPARWGQLADQALAAAQDPSAVPAALLAEAESAAGDHRGRGAWPSPFAHRRDLYVGALLLWAIKAFCRQESAVMRQTLADALLEAALAFKGRLARVLAPPSHAADAVGRLCVAWGGRRPQLVRKRRDIDDLEED